MAAQNAWIPYEAISAITIFAPEDRITGGFGFDPSTFTVITPGAEWTVVARPICGGDDLAGTLIGGGLAPVLFVLAEPPQAAYLRVVADPGPTPPNTLHLLVTGADLITPAPLGAALIVGFTALRARTPVVPMFP